MERVKRLPLKQCPSQLSQWQTEESSHWDGGNSYLTGFYFHRTILMIILQLATALSLWTLVIVWLWLSIWSMKNDEFWEIWTLPDLSKGTHLVYSRVMVSKSGLFYMKYFNGLITLSLHPSIPWPQLHYIIKGHSVGRWGELKKSCNSVW